MKHFQVENAPYPNMDGMVSTKIHQIFFLASLQIKRIFYK